jgi:sugar/nucleoside kinase (ribokinase family)
VISREYVDREHSEKDVRTLYREYITNCGGLVIFTFGNEEILYGRKGESQKIIKPFKVKAIDTLGAGDTFRAGVTYGVFKGWDDDKTVEFASALAAIVCTTFPSVTQSPTFAKVKKFIKEYDAGRFSTF